MDELQVRLTEIKTATRNWMGVGQGSRRAFLGAILPLEAARCAGFSLHGGKKMRLG